MGFQLPSSTGQGFFPSTVVKGNLFFFSEFSGWIVTDCKDKGVNQSQVELFSVGKGMKLYYELELKMCSDWRTSYRTVTTSY